MSYIDEYFLALDDLPSGHDVSAYGREVQWRRMVVVASVHVRLGRDEKANDLHEVVL